MALEEFRKNFGKVLMELIGTAVLLLTIQMTVVPGSTYGPVAIGLAILVMVYAGLPISGGHYNPAVTLSVFLRGAISVRDLFLYWAFQVGGAICGALLGALLASNSVVPGAGLKYHYFQAYVGELVFTALLCFVVLATCTNSTVDGNSYYGAAIGLTLFIGVVAMGPISGGMINPAVAISLSLMNGLSPLWYMIWTVLFELLGGVAGACLFYIVAPEEFGHFGEEARRAIGEAASLLPSRS